MKSGRLFDLKFYVFFFLLICIFEADWCSETYRMFVNNYVVLTIFYILATKTKITKEGTFNENVGINECLNVLLSCHYHADEVMSRN